MNRPALAAILVLSVAGCPGEQRAAPVVPQTPVAIAAAAATATEVIARPGEQMTYRVSVHNLEFAELVITVGEPTTLEGVEVAVVRMRTTSQKLLDMIRPIDDTLISWIDRATGRPLAYKATVLAQGSTSELEDSEIRFAPNSIPVQIRRGDQLVEEQQVVRDAAYDVPSILTFLRGWDGEPGVQVSVDLMRSKNAWRSSLVIAGFENMHTALGDLPVVRYDGEAVRLQRDGTPDADAVKRRFSIWITDDADRVPARMSANTDFGDVEVELQTYRAQ